MENYIDSLIEKAFSDGYEYAQREFGMSKEQKRKGRELMAKQMLEQMGRKPGDFGYDAVMGNPNNMRRLTAKNTMWNGTYADDMKLDKKDRLNLKITRKGLGAMRSWSGVHGTQIGNKH